MLFRTRCLLACCALLSLLTTCRSAMEDYQTEKFDLSAVPGAAGPYPVQIYRARFTNSAVGSSFPVPYGHYLQDSWGGAGISWGVGEALQAVPDSLHMVWFAWAENQFYEANIALPQQKIHALLRQGFWNKDKREHTTYNSFVVCVLPKGGLVVWLQGYNQVLIGRYQVPPTAYSWLRFNGGHPADRVQVVAEYQSEMLPLVRAEIAAGTISPRQWDAYLVRYPWHLEVVMREGKQARPLRLYNYSISYLNAENTSYGTSKDSVPYLKTLTGPTPKAVPESFDLFVENPYGEKYDIRVDPFDEAETLAAFQALATRHPKEPIVLRIEVDKLYTEYRLTLSNGFQTVPLDKAVVKIFEED